MNQGHQSKRSPWVSGISFTEVHEVEHFFHGGNFKFLQLDHGRCRGFGRHINLGDLDIFLFSSSNRTLFQGASHSSNRVVSIPLSSTGSMIWNGMSLSEASTIVWNRNAEFIRTGVNVTIATLVYKRIPFERNLHNWGGGLVEAWEKVQGAPLNKTDSHLAFKDCICDVIYSAARVPGNMENPEYRETLSNRITTRLFQAVEDSGKPEIIPTRACRNHHKIVSAARDYLDARQSKPISLMDLCQVTGTSARSLQTAFRNILGITPFEYLTVCRLRQARVLLKNAAGTGMNVTECAFRAGFTHLGRFSTAYGKYFDESPSDTLKQSRQ